MGRNIMARIKAEKFIKIALYKSDAEIVEKIQTEQGYVVADVIRTLLRQYGKEHFFNKPTIAEVQMAKIKAEKEEEARKQKEKEDWEKLSPKDFVLNTLQGEVDEKNDLALLCNGAGGTFALPLSTIKEEYKESPQVERHLSLIEGRYKFMGGLYGPEIWSAEKCAEKLEKWREEVKNKLAEQK
jgi:hypothetical protein